MWKFHQYLYNKQNITWPLADNITWPLADTREILSPLEDKIRIPARPCT